MKKILLASALLASPALAMQKSAAEEKKGQEGLLEFAASVAQAANPLIASTGDVLKKQITEPLAACQQQLIAQIVPPILAKQKEYHDTLLEQLQNLQAKIKALEETQANNKCCSIQ